MLSFFYLLGIMADWVFFLVLSLINYEYAGSSESNLYISYWLVILFVSVLLYSIFLLKYIKKGEFPRSLLYSLLPILLIIVLYLISFVKFGYNSSGNAYYAKVFVLMCIPSYLIGYVCSSYKNENKLLKKLVYFVTIGSGVLLLSLYRLVNGNVSSESLDSLGGTGRLGIGYLATHFFIILLFIYLFNEKVKPQYLPYVLKNQFKNFIFFSLLGIQFSTVVFSGSRGPLLNLIILSIIMIIIKLTQKNLINISKKLISITFILIGIISLFSLVGQNYFSVSTERTLTLFQLNKNTWAGGSGREDLYPIALQMFYNEPYFGRGPMGFLSESGTGMYPHNFILETLVDYGLVGLIVLILFLVLMIKKYIYKIKAEPSILLILLLFSSTLIELLVSGTLLANARFWFFIGLGMGLTNKILK